MGLVDDLRLRGVTSRVTEEMLYAEAIREVEDGVRRDGLWAMALAQSNMQEHPAQATYLKLRVQSLRDEIALLSVHAEQVTHKRREASQQVNRNQPSPIRLPVDAERDRQPKNFRDWVHVLLGAAAVVAVFAIAATLFEKLR